jgi:hypothetical protein
MSKPTLKPVLSKAQAAMEFAEPKKATTEKRAFYAPEGHKRLTINLPEALHKRLRQAALDRDCNATDIIVELLTKELGA